MKLSTEQRLALEKFMAATGKSQKAAVKILGDVFRNLKKEWESRPENEGKSATYRKLWDDFADEIDKTYAEVEWNSEPPCFDAQVLEIEHFDARGMNRVYGRGDYFAPHQSFHMDIWRSREGRLLMRCWSRCLDIDERSYAIKELAADAIPPIEQNKVLPEYWVPKAVRRAYNRWISESF